MRTLRNSWKSVTVTLIIATKDNKTLLCKKNDGIMRGFVTPVGGKVDKKDKTVKDGARREFKEETGLNAIQLYEAGRINVLIAGNKLKVIIHVFKCTWRGRLKDLSGEFSFLRFIPIDKIPWNKFIPGDRDWLEKILQGHRVKVNIRCGNNRTDLHEIRVQILP